MMPMITTTKGLMNSELLEKREGVSEDNESNRVTWVEYYDDGELVHRSVNLHIKKGVETKAIGGDIG